MILPDDNWRVRCGRCGRVVHHGRRCRGREAGSVGGWFPEKRLFAKSRPRWVSRRQVGRPLSWRLSRQLRPQNWAESVRDTRATISSSMEAEVRSRGRASTLRSRRRAPPSLLRLRAVLDGSQPVEQSAGALGLVAKIEPARAGRDGHGQERLHTW